MLHAQWLCVTPIQYILNTLYTFCYRTSAYYEIRPIPALCAMQTTGGAAVASIQSQIIFSCKINIGDTCVHRAEWAGQRCRAHLHHAALIIVCVALNKASSAPISHPIQHYYENVISH